VTYATSRYPTHLIDVLRLAGHRILVRPALPQDRELQRAFFAGLSDEARYFRFMTRLAELPAALAERFSNIDHIQHVALLAETCTTTDETMVGEARYVVEASDPGTCEFAVAVADAWRGAHLAHTLLQRLAGHAAAAGLRRMVADTISTNAAMVKLATRAGFTVRRKREDGRLLRLEKVLTATNRSRVSVGPSIGSSKSAA
jgi:RimJ/RimL family protein N-acetyltransferase